MVYTFHLLCRSLNQNCVGPRLTKPQPYWLNQLRILFFSHYKQFRNSVSRVGVVAQGSLLLVSSFAAWWFSHRIVAALSAITPNSKQKRWERQRARGVSQPSLSLFYWETRSFPGSSTSRFLFLAHWPEQDHAATLNDSRDKGRRYFITGRVAASDKIRIQLVRKTGWIGQLAIFHSWYSCLFWYLAIT